MVRVWCEFGVRGCKYGTSLVYEAAALVAMVVESWFINEAPPVGPVPVTKGA